MATADIGDTEPCRGDTDTVTLCDTPPYDTECPVCTNRYREPRILQCAHHFCQVCLEEIADRHSHGHVTCPTCRHVTPVTDRKAIAHLPRYLIVNEFTDLVTSYVKKIRVSNLSLNCGNCSHVQCSDVCVTCQMTLCDDCAEVHREESRHKMVPPSSTVLCVPHAKPVVSVCHTCRRDVMCCNRCLDEEHQDHNTENIATAGQKARIGLLVRKAKMDSTDTDIQVLSAIENMKQTASNSHKLFTQAVDSVRSSIKSVLESLDDMEEHVNMKLGSEVKELTIMQGDMKDYVDSKQSLQNHVHDLLSKASDHELITGERDMPSYDSDSYKQIIHKHQIELPKTDNLKSIKVQLDTFQMGLRTVAYLQT